MTRYHQPDQSVLRSQWEDAEELFSLVLATAGPDPSTPCLFQQVDALQSHSKLQQKQGFELQSARST
jgi:hypothetical protein